MAVIYELKVVTQSLATGYLATDYSTVTDTEIFICQLCIFRAPDSLMSLN